MSESLATRARGLADEAAAKLRSASDEASLARVKSSFLGKEGTITALLKAIPTLSVDERREAGSAINVAKKSGESFFAGARRPAPTAANTR